MNPICPQGAFVVGTDTNVGKTIVAGGMARMLRRRGMRVGVYKPFISGDPHFTDAQILARAAGLAGPGPLQPALLDVISPFRFRDPVAPGIGARREGRTINLDDALEEARGLGAMHEVMVVEGAGGLMVPLTEKLQAGACVLDLVEKFGLPALLVARTALGTINHTVLSVIALRSRNIPIGGIVLSQTDPGEEVDPDVIRAISQITGIEPSCVIPFTGGSEAILVGTAARALDQSGVWERLSNRS